ncbi:DUF4393 domain-containing protein [Fluviicola sp. SGL-29]|nr:DUF4393 domain-containing protein [Fluviicola sp. SGL-29]
MKDKSPIDINSSTVNKLIDVAKDFLDVIIKPGAQQVGLLVGEKIQSFRIMNQVNILLKVKQYVEKRGISINAIPLKILVPLLEHSSLEEEDELQDLWAKMLTNMLDSDENNQKHIFPYILSQISLDDYKALQELYCDERDYWTTRKDFKTALEKLEFGINVIETNEEMRNKIDAIEQTGFYIFEADNLHRLGLIRRLPPPIIIPEFEASNQLGASYIRLEAKYDVDDYGYRMTDLGDSFIEVCKFKEQDNVAE